MATHDAPAQPRLGAADHGRAVSAEEFADADFQEPWRYEREAGRLLVMAPDGIEHDATSEPLRDHLGAYRLPRPDVVQMVRSESWLRVPGGPDRIGDIAVHLHRDPGEPVTVERVPEMMYEIVSGDPRDRTRDYAEKRAEYHRLGVREYVIGDRFRGLVTVLRDTAEAYQEHTLAAADAYTSPLLPGLVIPLAEVLGR